MRTELSRRSRFELCFEIIELCKFPGLPISRLSSNARVPANRLSDLLFKLIEDQLIHVETRPRSVTGDKRKTDYYVRTPEGENILNDYTELRSKIP